MSTQTVWVETSWHDRLEPIIEFTSPSGEKFKGFWQGGTRSVEKSLGIFKYPKVKGAVVQDLDVDADRYPITFFIEGPNHDKKAKKFYRACKERGHWKIKHPVWGLLTLQLISVAESNKPVEAGNLTEFTTEWIEPLLDVPVAAPQLGIECKAVIEKTKDAASDTFVENTDVSLMDQIIATIGKVMNIISKMKSIIAGVMQLVSTMRSMIMGIITNLVSAVVGLVSMVHDLINLPGMLIQDLGERFSYFENILSSVVEISPSSPTAEGRISAQLHELIATSVLTGMAQSLVDAEMSTREEAMSYLERFNAACNFATVSLDATQALYAGQPINVQYVNRMDIAELRRAITELLLRRSFDLSVAKRMTLTTDRPPVEIAITEGVDLDTFIATNQLQGEDVLLLRAGREVVVYL